MKKQCILIALCLFSFCSFAQTEKTKLTNNPTGKAKKIELTAEQRKKLTKIDREHKANRLAVDNDPKISPEEKKIKIRKLQDEKIANMRKVITDEQWLEFNSDKPTQP
jgi:hypothetical protein